VSLRRVTAQVSLIALMLVPLAGCSGGFSSKSLQDAFAADPRLKNKPTTQPTAALPPTFPQEIPKYPNATLTEVASTGEMPVQQSSEVLTTWASQDSSDRILNFYRDELQKNGWKLTLQPNDKGQGIFEATRENLGIAVAIQASQAGKTTYTIETRKPNAVTQAQPSDSFVGPKPTASPVANASPSDSFPDLDKAPKEIQSYVKDLAKLEILTPASSKDKSKPSNNFEPNKSITRREYARWLVAANNRVYENRPARQIRLGVDSAQPAFQDVSAKDPDFGAIQGLAETGLIPSPLAGDSTTVSFRPNSPLSREEMILWKVPVDTRQPLPNATIESVVKTWAFQDAEKIDSKALRAVLADFQNGDQANIRRAFGYTTIFQPKRPVTRAEAAAVLWYFGFQGEGISVPDSLKGAVKTN
jgi:S-layer homology domain